MAEQGITDQTVLTVDFSKGSVTVKIQGQSKKWEVDPDDKISTIRDKLTEMGYQAGFKLVASGQNLNLDKTIKSAGIKSGAVIVADYNEITIKYKILGKTDSVKVDPDNAVSTIKDAIKSKEDITTDAFKLKLGE
jgi:ribosomal 50S subunit-recycling heat shock protein